MNNKNKILLIIVVLIFLIFSSYNISNYMFYVKYNNAIAYGSDQQLQEIKDLVAINEQKEVVIQKIDELQEQIRFEHKVCFNEK